MCISYRASFQSVDINLTSHTLMRTFELLYLIQRSCSMRSPIYIGPGGNSDSEGAVLDSR